MKALLALAGLVVLVVGYTRPRYDYDAMRRTADEDWAERNRR